MNNALEIFKYEDLQIRIKIKNNEPEFSLKDILAAMGSKTHTTAAIESIETGLGKGDVTNVPLETSGGIQEDERSSLADIMKTIAGASTGLPNRRT